MRLHGLITTFLLFVCLTSNVHACFIPVKAQKASNWPVNISSNVLGTIAVGNIIGDAKQEVLVACVDGNVWAWDSAGHSLVRFPISLNERTTTSVCLGDVDGDNSSEILLASRVELRLVRGNGTTILKLSVKNLGTPALADLNGDGMLEIVTAARGNITALYLNGTILEGWPLSIPAFSTVYSPIIAEFSNTSEGPEILVASNNTLYLLSSQGANVSNWPLILPSNIVKQPLVGHITNTNALQILVVTEDHQLILYSPEGQILNQWSQEEDLIPVLLTDLNQNGHQEMVLMGRNTNKITIWDQFGNNLPGWPMTLPGEITSFFPTSADLDNDGKNELLFSIGQTERWGQFLAFNEDGSRLQRWPKSTIPQMGGSAIADLDLDGHLEVLSASEDRFVYKWDTSGRGFSPWSQYAGSMVHWGSVWDLDSDGLNEIEEKYYGTNATLADSDQDGFWDGLEISKGTDPLNNTSSPSLDSDLDQLSDVEENLYGTNPYWWDTDGDKMPDGWEHQYGLNPQDGSDAGGDLDGEGLTNLDEYFYGTLPTAADSDADGLNDNDEKIRFLNPWDEDSDKDRFSDLEEVSQGNNALDATDNPYTRFNLINIVGLVVLTFGVAIVLVGYFLYKWFKSLKGDDGYYY